VPPVVTAIKADMRCAAVAAASILAKTTRDALMVELAKSHPGYGWHENKGYASPEHIEALRLLGPSAAHRRSWSLPGVGPENYPVQQQDEWDPAYDFATPVKES
jgi:ribonuclease HII